MIGIILALNKYEYNNSEKSGVLINQCPAGIGGFSAFEAAMLIR